MYLQTSVINVIKICRPFCQQDINIPTKVNYWVKFNTDLGQVKYCDVGIFVIPWPSQKLTIH